ncbi:MAG: hypothetical protein C5B57_06375 [Blastocatellia bacterium]|nr:MAG: hypothetical protein C5B57_06375 [Blastocatellia bacterium]
MALEKLQIVPEKEGGRLQFDDSSAIVALFNPDELGFNRSVGWQQNAAAQRDVPELQFTTAEPRTLTVKLFFDTYDTPSLPKQDVRKKHTDKVLNLTTVEKHGDKHRPPVCRLRWGSAGYFFQGVLEQLDQRFTLFMEDGTPVRATLTCTFKEWRTNYDDLNRQARQSSDIAKMRVLRRGDTLSSIAATEYLDPALWRAIAVANNIDDPLRLSFGGTLIVPKLPLNRKPFAK